MIGCVCCDVEDKIGIWNAFLFVRGRDFDVDTTVFGSKHVWFKLEVAMDRNHMQKFGQQFQCLFQIFLYDMVQLVCVGVIKMFVGNVVRVHVKSNRLPICRQVPSLLCVCFVFLFTFLSALFIIFLSHKEIYMGQHQA